MSGGEEQEDQYQSSHHQDPAYIHWVPACSHWEGTKQHCQETHQQHIQLGKMEVVREEEEEEEVVEESSLKQS